MQAHRFLRNGCEDFLALVLDSKRGQVKLENIWVVKEFQDVFPEELSGLPLEREVDLSVEILQGIAPISRAPYRSSWRRDLFDQCFSLGCTYFVCQKEKWHSPDVH